MSIASLKFQKKSNLMFTLSNEARDMLIKTFPPSFSKVCCQHIQIINDVSAGQLAKYQAAHQEDSRVLLTGMIIGSSQECFTVSVAGDVMRRFGDGGAYLLTLSVEPPLKSSDANKILKDSRSHKVVFEIPIEISGTFQLVKQ